MIGALYMRMWHVVVQVGPMHGERSTFERSVAAIGRDSARGMVVSMARRSGLRVRCVLSTTEES